MKRNGRTLHCTLLSKNRLTLIIFSIRLKLLSLRLILDGTQVWWRNYIFLKFIVIVCVANKQNTSADKKKKKKKKSDVPFRVAGKLSWENDRSPATTSARASDTRFHMYIRFICLLNRTRPKSEQIARNRLRCVSVYIHIYTVRVWI